MGGRGGRRGVVGALCGALLGMLAPALSPLAAQAAITIDDVQVTESSAAVSATFTIVRSAGTLAPATSVTFATADGSATAPADYVAATGSVAFAAALLGGTQTQQVAITVQGDLLDEDDESFGVRITGAEVTDGEGSATIVDDDPLPVLDVADAPPAIEGGLAVFRIGLSAPSGRDVRVGVHTADGSAAAGQDYAARAGTVAIPAGATSVSLAVALLDDAVHEPTETFELRLGAAQAALVGDGVGAATVLDDDDPPLAPGLTPGQGSAAVAAPGLGGARGSPAPAAPATRSPSSGLGVSAPRLRRPRTIAVTLACPPQAGRCKGRLTIFSRPSRRSKIKLLRSERRLARRAFELAGGRTRTLLIALGRRDQSLLRRVGRMKVRAYVVTQDRAGRTVVRRVNGTLVARTAHSS